MAEAAAGLQRELRTPFVPAGTPRAIVDAERETVRIARDPAYIDQIKTMGTDVVSSSAEALALMVKISPLERRRAALGRARQ